MLYAQLYTHICFVKSYYIFLAQEVIPTKQPKKQKIYINEINNLK